MKLINVTNSYTPLVNNQLENTDAYLVEVYSAGNTTIVYTEAAQHAEILLTNKHRTIKQTEVDEVLSYFLKKIATDKYDKATISTIELQDVVEISIPLTTTPTHPV